MKKHRINVLLDWQSIDKDVQDKAYRMTRLTKLGVQDETQADKVEHELTLSDEDMNMLRRALTQGLAEVITMCREYVWSKSHSSDNYIFKEENITIVLMMPLNYNLAGNLSLGKMIHKYIVGTAMLEWFRYTVPARAAEQQTICDQARKEILTIINARVRSMRDGESLTVIVEE